MLSLSKAKASMLKKVPGWVEIMVHACLEAMGEFKEDEGSGSGLEAWLVDDVSILLSCFLPYDAHFYLGFK